MVFTKKRALRYTLLPEILPRVGKLFGTGFYHVAFLIAVIFQSVRLLPPQHPYLDPANLGRFGIRNVIAEASGNLKLDRRNIDQTIIFFTILIGMGLLVFQIVLMALTFVAQPVFASPTFWDWFVIPSPHYAYDEERDIALMLLDRVFGVGSTADASLNIFNTCVARGIPCVNHYNFSVASPATFPYPIHIALHNLFSMYSIGIGVISLMIILYFITTIVGETAVTGTPFGQRFNRAWAPVRLILFFALIAPLNIGVDGRGGLNGAQLITLYTAKFGSNFATNAWGVFNTTTSRTYYQNNELTAIPNVPNLAYLGQFWTIANACVEGEKIVNNVDVKPYLVKDSGTASLPWINLGMGPLYLGQGGPTAHPDARDLSYWMDGWQALQFVAYGDAKIVIGVQDTILYNEYKGAVYPVCGEITIPSSNSQERAALAAFQMYWNINYSYQNVATPTGIGATLPALNDDIIHLAECYMYRELPSVTTEDCNPADPFPDYNALVQQHIEHIETFVNSADGLQNIIDAGVAEDYSITDEMIQRGWGGAAIWYNRIAQYNGSLVTGVNAIPQISKWPILMEKVRQEQMEHSPTIIGSQTFSLDIPATPDEPVGQRISLPGDQSNDMARAYYQLFKIWEDNNISVSPATASVENPILDTINSILGADGLFDMRKPTTGSNAHPDGNPGVHPLALLSSLGRSLLEASIRNLGIAAGSSLGSSLLSIFGGGSTAGKVAMQTASSFFGTVATAIMLIGFMLYYVLPFMPFIYFFFAIGGWVKSIFEAMVAMPIWALAHIRIDGEGMPGPGASNGYFLLLEIFIRPILILAGLIGSIIIFAAMVQVLNQIFDLMVNNISGASAQNPNPADVAFYRGPIDELFFSIMYAAIVYMMGLSCFKLIDSVPNNILRWMGVSVSTFQETAGDPAGQFSQSIYQKGNMTIGQLSGFTQNNSGRVAAMVS